jgi:4-hydroxy-tetrahydrodipicolinate synthase
MNRFPQLAGVFAAAVTPLHRGELDLAGTAPWLSFLAGRGCHGALLLGTTGEGPSFSFREREALFRAAVEVRQEHPDFRLLAGVGTPSLDETIALCRLAFEVGLDGVVALPPYYFRSASQEGLFTWFSQVLRQGVPAGSPLLGYHIPPVSGVPLSLDLLARLQDAFPDRFAGMKDSSADPQHAAALGQRFGSDLVVLNGNDSLFTLALDNQASGCITALANLLSPALRRVWEAHRQGQTATAEQAALEQARKFMDRYPPAPPLIKALLPALFGLPRWETQPPLLNLPYEMAQQVAEEARLVIPVEDPQDLAPPAP